MTTATRSRTRALPPTARWATNSARLIWRNLRYLRATSAAATTHGPFDLAGRRALVSGGSMGIGAAIVAELTRRGATVTSVDVTEPLSPAAGVDYVEGDVRTFDFSGLPPSDLLVANAGVVDAGPDGRLADADLERLLDINVTGLIRTLSAPTTADGRALVISSRSSVGPETQGLAYAASKAAGLVYGYGLSHRCPTTTAIVGITHSHLFLAEADHHGRPRPTLPDDLPPAEYVARRCIAAVEAGLGCVVTDPDVLRDVAGFCHWLGSAELMA